MGYDCKVTLCSKFLFGGFCSLRQAFGDKVEFSINSGKSDFGMFVSFVLDVMIK